MPLDATISERAAHGIGRARSMQRSKRSRLPRLFDVRCRLDLETGDDAVHLFNIIPADHAGHAIVEQALEIEPDACATHWTDRSSGNRFFRLAAPSGRLSLTYRACVERLPAAPPPRDRRRCDASLPASVYPFLNPSRYCQSDRLENFAQDIFERRNRDVDLVRAICGWVYENIAYRAGSSTVHTCALETLHERAGVCRDFAHLAIALCRACGIPARYVTGYAWRLEPQDFHAIIEAWCYGGWRLFDPTGRCDPCGLVRIGTGLDASQVPFAALFGNAALTGLDVSCVGRRSARDASRRA